MSGLFASVFNERERNMPEREWAGKTENGENIYSVAGYKRVEGASSMSVLAKQL